MSQEIMEHVQALIHWLLSPEVLSQIGVYFGVGASIVAFGSRVFKKLWHNLEKKQNEEIEGIKNSMKALTISFQEMQQTQARDFLRLQIITGIQSGRLSVSELLALYDEYINNGGNSYITRLVNDYIEEYKQKETTHDH